MKVAKDKPKDKAAEPTYSLNELSVKELKNIRTGLEMLYEKYNNSRIKLMVADINAGALKDHEDSYSIDIDPETLKRRNKTMLKALNKLVPVSDAHPVPLSLQGFTFK